MRVAVTGASGFIGGAVATALVADGHTVTGFGRSPGGWRGADYRRWDIAAGPLESPPAVDAVVHCAALADDSAPRAEAMRVNVDGTRHVAESFPGVRIVHLSTSSVYDAFTPTVLAREDAPFPHRFLSAYSETKALAERVLQGSDAVILRPHAVYGPGDTTLLPRVIDAVRGGRLLLPAGARVRHSLTRIDHLVDAVRLSLTGPAGTYNVADAEPVLLSDVLTEFLRRRGVEARIVALPYPVAFGLARVSEWSGRRRRRRPRLTRYAVSQVGRERTLDLTAARERLGYTPGPTSLAGAASW